MKGPFSLMFYREGAFLVFTEPIELEFSFSLSSTSIIKSMSVFLFYSRSSFCETKLGHYTKIRPPLGCELCT